MTQQPPLHALCSIALQKVVETTAPIFERDQSQALVLGFGTSVKVTERFRAGEPADLVLLTAALIDALTAEGKLIAGSRVDIAQSRVGLAVRADAPLPDISNAERFKQVLLASKSVAYSHPSSGGASGVHFAKVMARLGIAEAIDEHAKYGYGTPVAEFLLRGEADVAVQQVSELKLVDGIQIVALPDEVQSVTVFSAGIATASTQAVAARALVDLLTGANAAEAIAASGMELVPAR